MILEESKAKFLSLLEAYEQKLDSYSESDFSYKKDEHWSLGQMYGHLSSGAIFYFIKNATTCLEDTCSVLGEKTPMGTQVFLQEGFPEMDIKLPAEIKAPEPSALTKEEARTFFQKVRKTFDAAYMPVLLDTQLKGVSHPAFGSLSSHEWLILNYYHFKHHLRQQKKLESFLSESVI